MCVCVCVWWGGGGWGVGGVWWGGGGGGGARVAHAARTHTRRCCVKQASWHPPLSPHHFACRNAAPSRVHRIVGALHAACSGWAEAGEVASGVPAAAQPHGMPARAEAGCCRRWQPRTCSKMAPPPVQSHSHQAQASTHTHAHTDLGGKACSPLAHPRGCSPSRPSPPTLEPPSARGRRKTWLCR